MTITGTSVANTIDLTKTVLNQPLPTANPDTSFGLGGNDVIEGGAGDDKVFGGAGIDILFGNAGADELDGDADADTVTYANSDNGVTIALDGLAGTGGDAAGDKLTEIENLVGSTKADDLTGNNLANKIEGGLGDDTISGDAGNDALDGGAGIDTLDYSYLAAGQNLLLTLGRRPRTSRESSAVVKNGAATLETDSVKNFENVFGGAGDDKLTGNAGNNVLKGGFGADLFVGGAGADTFYGNITNNDKGDIGDTVDYSASNTAIAITIIGNDFSIAGKGGHAEGDLLAGINKIIGSNFNDVLMGDVVNDVFAVTFGGGLGDDRIGSVGNASGTNILDGGANSAAGDTIDYSWASNVIALTIALSNTNNALVNVDSNGAGATQIKNFENIIGGAGNDILTGNNVANVIEGGAGADKLTGNGGVDTVSYASSLSSVFVNLTITTTQEATYDFGAGAVGNGDAAGDILQGFTNFIGSGSDDVVQGNGTRADVISGGKGNDDLSGGEGNFADKLDGGEGNDNLFGGLGADILIGGLGLDTIAYQTGSATAGVIITLGKDGAQTSGTGGDAAGDLISGVENIFGSDFKHLTTGAGDKLTGNNLANELYGNKGNDILDGAAGNDTLVGGSDNDTLTGGSDADILDGGNGVDTISYALSAAGVTLNLNDNGKYDVGDPTKRDTAGPIQTGGDAQGDTLWSIENIIGSKKNDVLIGNEVINIIDGGEGDDLLTSNSGADILVGGLGNDTVTYLTSGGGVTVSLLGQGTYNAATMVLTGGTAQSGGDAVGNKFSSIENLVGSGSADELTGDGNANVIEGGGGADLLIGGLGTDTVSYANAGVGVTVSLLEQGQSNANGTAVLGTADGQESPASDSDNDLLYGFEGILGSNYDDTLTGSATVASKLTGGNGVDTLTGGTAADTLLGGEGNDTIVGKGGADTINGGAGIDLLSFSYIANVGNIGVTIALGKNATTAAAASASAASHQIFDIEDIEGTTYADKLTGNDSANFFSGLGGKDTLIGLGGEDFLQGGTGNDTLAGGAGADDLSGGGDFDAVDYSASLQGVTVDLFRQGTYSSGDIRDQFPVVQEGGDAQGDQLWGIEKVIGSGQNDKIEGADLIAATLDGGNGNDVIIARLAGETLVGGGNTTVVAGNATLGDTLSYIRSDLFVDVSLLKQGTYNATTGVFTGGTAQANGAAAGDFIAGFENLIGSIHADTLTGDNNANVIEGEDGADTLIGGGGSDTVSYKSSVFQVKVELGNQGTFNATTLAPTSTPIDQEGGHAEGDLLYGFENIIGSDRADIGDVLYGDNNNNIIDGGAGGDELRGFGGADTLRGGADNDVFYAGGGSGIGADSYDGGAGFDIVTYQDESLGVTVALGANGASANVTGGPNAANDTLIGIESVIGGDGNDKFTGNNLAHQLDGGKGNDTLIGGTGNSTIYGQGGNDTIVASIGTNEVYQGGDDSDTLTFASFGVNTSVTVNLATDVNSVTGITTLSVSAFETLIGGLGNDVLTGNASTATKITGGGGNDKIQGGSAVDTFTGGAGNDTFVFVAPGQGKDVFTDFTNGDRLQINSASFGGGLPLTGSLPDATWLVVGTAPVANAGHGQFLYNTTNDTLYWDVDGSGINDAPIEIGQFGSAVLLKLADFTLV